MLIQGVQGVLVVSWRRRVGGVGAVALWWLGVCGVSLRVRKSNLECIFLIGRTMHHSLQRLHAVVMVAIVTAEDDCYNE